MSEAYGLAASRLSSALAWSGIRTIHSSFGVAETDIVVVEADTVAQKAKMPFYGNHEPNLLIRIMDVMLLYWWSAGPPSVFSMDSPWWWTGVAIRQAREIGLHREPKGE